MISFGIVWPGSTAGGCPRGSFLDLRLTDNWLINSPLFSGQTTHWSFKVLLEVEKLIKRFDGNTHWFFLPKDTKTWGARQGQRGKVYTLLFVILFFCLLLLATHEILQTASAQSSTVTLEFFSWLAGKTSYLAIHSTSSDIERWVQEIKNGRV